VPWFLSGSSIYFSNTKLKDSDIEIPDKPSPYHYWDFETNKWSIEIDDLKILKLNEIYEAFDNELNTTRPFLSKVINKEINADRESLQNMKDLLRKMDKDNMDKTVFRCFDDSYVEVTREQLSNMIDELINYGLGLFRKKWQYENIINSADNIDDIINLKWE